MRPWKGIFMMHTPFRSRPRPGESGPDTSPLAAPGRTARRCAARRGRSEIQVTGISLAPLSPLGRGWGVRGEPAAMGWFSLTPAPLPDGEREKSLVRPQ